MLALQRGHSLHARLVDGNLILSCILGAKVSVGPGCWPPGPGSVGRTGIRCLWTISREVMLRVGKEDTQGAVGA